MLPDLRFLFGASLAAALLGVLTLGLATTVQLSHRGKISPLEASRSLAYAEHGASGRPTDPELVRMFDALGRTSATVDNTASEPAILPPATPLEQQSAAPQQAAAQQVAPQQAAAEQAAAPPPASPQPAAVAQRDLPELLPDEAIQPPAAADPPQDERMIGPATESDPSPSTSAAALPRAAPAQPPISTAPEKAAPSTEIVPDATPSAAMAPPASAAAVAPAAAGQPATLVEPGAASQTETAVDQNSNMPAADTPPDTLQQATPAAPRATHHPVKTRHLRAKPSIAKAPKAKLAKARRKPALRARAAVQRPTASTGYPVGSQGRTSWGWDFK